MAISCGACGKLMRYTQTALTCSGTGCKAMAHYMCVASTKQDWRCVSCCYPAEISVQYLLNEILRKGSGLELLQGLIGKINDLLTDINSIKDENETLKNEISLLTNRNPNDNLKMNKNETTRLLFTATATASSNKDVKQLDSSQITTTTTSTPAAIATSTTQEESSSAGKLLRSTTTTTTTTTTTEQLRKVSIFVTWSNTKQSETYLHNYLQKTTNIKTIECVRVSCYDTYSMFQIRVQQQDVHLLANPLVYPEGCKLEVYNR